MAQVGLLAASMELPTTTHFAHCWLELEPVTPPFFLFVKGKECRDSVYVAFGTLVGVPPECLLAFVTYLGARALR